MNRPRLSNNDRRIVPLLRFVLHMRRAVSVMLSCILLAAGPLSAQAPANLDATTQQGILVGDLRRDLTMTANWTVTQQIVANSLFAYKASRRNSAALAALEAGTGFKDLQSPAKIEDFIGDLRSEGVRITTQRLIHTGVPDNVAQIISERLQRRYLFDLQKALLTFAVYPKGVTQQSFSAAVASAVRQGSNSLLSTKLTQSDYRAAAVQIRDSLSKKSSIPQSANPYRLVSTNSGSESAVDKTFAMVVATPQLLKVPNLESSVVSHFSTDAKAIYDSLDQTTKEYVLDGVTTDILRRASGFSVSANRSKLTIQNATNVLAQVGQLQELERTTVSQVVQGATDLTAGLDAAHALLTSNWKLAYQKANKITGTSDFVAPYEAQITNTVHLVNDISKLTSGGKLNGETVSELAALIPVPGAKDIGMIAVGFSKIADGQATFAQEGQLLLGSLANLTGAQPLKEIQSAFSSVAPILQAAGPLLALAGLSNPIGAVSMIGGLLGGGGPFGGGGGDEAALAAINQKLAEIDHKLDIVIGKLDQLAQEIATEHVEVMNALESISFDVNRTRQLLVTTEVKKYSDYCQDFKAFVDDPSRPVKVKINDLIQCNEKLFDLNRGSTNPILIAIYNLNSPSLQDAAIKKLQNIAAVHDKHEDWGQQNCFSLVVATYSAHDVAGIRSVGINDAKSASEKALCTNVLSIPDMLDSGMLSYFVSLEASTADLSWKIGQVKAKQIMWDEDPKSHIVSRWNNEVSLLNSAVGQQALLSGDVTIPKWAQMFDDRQALDPEEKQALQTNAVLAQNAVRYWLADHLSATRAQVQPPNPNGYSIPLQYAYSYNACSPKYLESLTEFGGKGSDSFKVDFSKVHFNWTKAVEDGSAKPGALDLSDPKPCPTAAGQAERWCLKIDGLDNCVKLPTPGALTLGQLLRADNLEALLNARNTILELAESTDLISGLDAGQQLLMLEALATKWAVDNRRSKSVMSPTSQQTLAAVHFE